MRYLIKISYDGSKFYGFQRQNNLRSVQKDIEDILSSYFGYDIKIKGAGRTDRGVHAKGQMAHFNIDKSVSISKLKKFINKQATDFKIRKIHMVSDDIHSRFSVKKKHYSYKISFDKKDFDSEYFYYQKKLDIKEMKQASKLFIGVHNFQNFVSGTRDNYDCIVYNIKFRKIFNKLTIHFYGKSFYRYMVRNMVGALIDVGKHKAKPERITELLNSKKTDKMLSTAPAKGLTLEKIYY
ncbi:MAG: tRNA pseudouridine(38-40) synthase TruA [Bacilli bacterium]|nr:tRNA pseudouridine(38-40) synthase TruA [Bacilli bacterium]